MKICIISTAALPAPPSGYGGLEWIAYHSATELSKLGNEVTLITTNDSSALGISEAVKDDKVIGHLNIVAAGPSAWNYNGERDMFLNYHNWLEANFSTEGVIIDHSWWGYPYYSITGGEIQLDGTRTVSITAHPDMRIIHVIHGVTGWRKPTGEYVPPLVPYPRILGVSKTHAQYLSNCFGKPVRYVFNGVKIPDITADKEEIEQKKDNHLQDTAVANTDVSSYGYLLSLNRISREKGIHNSIDVSLATKTPLKIVGDDSHVFDQKYVFEIMERCARSGGLVEYVGGVDNDRKWEYIRNCRALIACPDLSNYVESFYMAAVEGWSQGKPILSLSNGGLADIVVDGVNGFQCPNIETMKEILVNGKELFVQEGESNMYYKRIIKLEDIGQESIKQEAQKYTIERMAQGYLDLCQGVERDDPSYRW